MKKTDVDPVEIAQKQRHLFLLNKVKDSRILSKKELEELAKFEAKNKTTKAQKPLIVTPGGKKKSTPKKSSRPVRSRRLTSNGAKKKKSTKKSTKRATKKSTKRAMKRSTKKRTTPLPVRPAVIKALGLEAKDLAEADAQLNFKTPLTLLLAGFDRLKAAWQRGRLLRNVRELAATAATTAEAEEAIGLEQGELTKLLEADIEIADIWNTERLNIILAIKTALVSQAKEGKPRAIANIEKVLRNEIIGKRQVDLHRVTIAQLVEITGYTRQGVHNWYVKHGLQRNSDTTFDMAVFIPWLVDFTLQKANRGANRQSVAVIDPLKAAKAEKLEIELARQKGRMLDREIVLAGLLARAQGLRNAFDKLDNVAMAIHGQPVSKINEILKAMAEDICRAQCTVPEELQLPTAAAKKFARLLEGLKPEGSEDR